MSRTRTAYAIEVDLTSQTTESDDDIGLNNGVLRYITGRADLDGTDSILPLTYEGGESFSGAFYEGFLLKNGIGTASNYVDIETAGNYGSLSAFNFTIKNIAELLKATEYNITGQPITLYIMIGTELIPQWTGTVSSMSNTDSSLTFACNHNIKAIHKTIPPTTASATEFENIDNDSVGTPLPIAFGDIPYHKAEVVDSVYQPELIVMENAGGTPEQDARNTTFLTDYYVTDPEYIEDMKEITVVLYVGEMPILADQYATGEYYFRVYMDRYGDTDDSELVLITSNTATDVTEKTINLVLLSSPSKLTTGVGRSIAAALPSITFDSLEVVFPTNEPQYSSNSVFVQIVKLPSRYVISNGEIEEIVLDDAGQPQSYVWDSVKGEYEKLAGLVTTTSTTGDDDFAYPNIGIKGGVSSSDGSVEIIDLITPVSAIKLGDMLDSGSPAISTGWNSNTPAVINDGKINIGHSFSYVTSRGYTRVLAVEIELPSDIDYSQYSSMHAGLNIAVPVDTNTLIPATLGASILGVYPSGSGKINSEGNSITSWSHSGQSYILDNMLEESYELYKSLDYRRSVQIQGIPNNFYEDNDGRFVDGEENYYDYYNWWTSEVESDGEYIRSTKDQSELSGFSDFVKYSGPNPLKILVLIRMPAVAISHQIIGDLAIFGIKNSSVFKNLRLRVKGEKFGDEETNNVYNTYRHILETYDGISSDNIDYGNLPTVRDSWHVGGVITEQKSSYEYLKQLCRQSMTTVTVKRNGDLRLSAFLDDESTPTAFDETTIQRDSIGKVGKSALSKLYNEFFLNFTKNIDSGGYDSQLSITRVDEDSFPPITGDDWKTYAGGFVNYASAKQAWEVCHDSYLKNAAINKATTELSELSFYVDKVIFDSSLVGNAENSAWKLLNLYTGWATIQKEIVSFNVPLTLQNAKIEAMDVVTFSDSIKTGGVARKGWIVKTETKATENIKKLHVILLPDDITFITSGTIYETGSAPDQIVESGSRPDQIIEGASGAVSEWPYYTSPPFAEENYEYLSGGTGFALEENQIVSGLGAVCFASSYSSDTVFGVSARTVLEPSIVDNPGYGLFVTKSFRRSGSGAVGITLYVELTSSGDIQTTWTRTTLTDTQSGTYIISGVTDSGGYAEIPDPSDLGELEFNFSAFADGSLNVQVSFPAVTGYEIDETYTGMFDTGPVGSHTTIAALNGTVPTYITADSFTDS